VKHVAHGAMVRGKLRLIAPRALSEALTTWDDGPVTVTVERPAATRSVQANAYYWGVVVAALADYTGYTPDETHDILKMQFLSKALALARKNGTVVAEFVVGGSTTQLTSPEFFDYVERIRQWAFEELDVNMPPPDPGWRQAEEPR
jgi:hypothetical protein